MIGISAIFINLVLIAIWIIYRIIVIKKNKNFNKMREVGISLFFIYFLAVLGLTLFKSGTLNLSVDTYFNANLIPIKETIEMFKDNPLGIRYALYNVVGNIILFIPFGFFIPLLFSKSNKLFRVASYGFIFSLIIESLQFFTRFNSTDIDDIIFNTLGAFIGILVYRLAFKIVKHKKVLNIVEKITDDSEVNLVKLSVKPLGAMLISLIGIGMFGLYFSTYSESLTNEEMAQKVFRHNEVNTDSLITKELGDYKLFLKDSGDFLEIGSVKKVFSNRYNNEQGIEICKNVNGKYKAQVIQNWNGNKSQEQKQILVVFGKNDKAKNLNVKFKKYDFTETLKENEPFIFAYEINEEINFESEQDNILEDIRNLNEGIKPKNLSIEFLDGNGALCDNIKFDRYVSSDE